MEALKLSPSSHCKVCQLGVASEKKVIRNQSQEENNQFQNGRKLRFSKQLNPLGEEILQQKEELSWSMIISMRRDSRARIRSPDPGEVDKQKKEGDEVTRHQQDALRISPEVLQQDKEAQIKSTSHDTKGHDDAHNDHEKSSSDDDFPNEAGGVQQVPHLLTIERHQSTAKTASSSAIDPLRSPSIRSSSAQAYCSLCSGYQSSVLLIDCCQEPACLSCVQQLAKDGLKQDLFQRRGCPFFCSDPSSRKVTFSLAMALTGSARPSFSTMASNRPSLCSREDDLATPVKQKWQLKMMKLLDEVNQREMIKERSLQLNDFELVQDGGETFAAFKLKPTLPIPNENGFFFHFHDRTAFLGGSSGRESFKYHEQAFSYKVGDVLSNEDPEVLNAYVQDLLPIVPKEFDLRVSLETAHELFEVGGDQHFGLDNIRKFNLIRRLLEAAIRRAMLSLGPLPCSGGGEDLDDTIDALEDLRPMNTGGQDQIDEPKGAIRAESFDFSKDHANTPILHHEEDEEQLTPPAPLRFPSAKSPQLDPDQVFGLIRMESPRANLSLPQSMSSPRQLKTTPSRTKPAPLPSFLLNS